jgi:hypothetical protein
MSTNSTRRVCSRSGARNSRDSHNSIRIVILTTVLSSSRTHRLIFIAGLTVWVVTSLIQLLSGYLLNHDEAQYAIAAKDMFAGAEPRWFYVSYGMNAIAGPGILAGGSECALRFVPFVLGIGFVLAAWQLARCTFGDATAAWVVAVLAGSRSYVRNSVELLTDMPAATCLIAATAILVGELGREHGPRWRIMVAAPLLSAALYVRYGSSVPIGILTVVAVTLGWRTIARRPAPVIATAMLFVVLFVPHAVMSIHLMGSPFGILLASQGVPPHRSITDGLVTYLTTNPLVLYGVLPPPVMIAGLFGLRRDRRVAFLWLVAIADIVALGMLTLAQVRYIFFGTVLLVILGTDVIRRVIVAQAPRIRIALGAFAMATIVVAWILVVRGGIGYDFRRAANNRAMLAAAAAIRADAHGSICHVAAVPYAQLEWYSGCDSRASMEEALAAAQPIYFMSDDRAGFDQLPGQHREVLDIPGLVHVIRLDPVR